MLCSTFAAWAQPAAPSPFATGPAAEPGAGPAASAPGLSRERPTSGQAANARQTDLGRPTGAVPVSQQPPASITPPAAVPPDRPRPVPEDEVRVTAVTQERAGSKYRLRGAVVLETSDMELRADEVDYDEDTGEVEARGHVRFWHFAGGERLEADRVEYNVNSETGKYYNVRGSSPAKVEARPGLLTTAAPFTFEGKWAEREKSRYILHEGTITNCRLPDPWWTLRGPRFDIIPGDRAIARNTIFRLKGVPLFYTPFFYKSLKRAPRKSGLLTPNLGNSSRRGKMIGAGYYWVINRSYDAMYRTQLFTQRGVAHHVDFRGKPSQTSDFNMILYGVNDRGPLLEDGRRGKPESGFLLTVDGRAELGHGFSARAAISHLSSFVFRQSFTESFFEAIYSEVHSIGFVTRHWSSYGLNVVAEENVNFQTLEPNDKISTRKLPSLEFNSRDRQVSERVLPVWVSFDMSAAAVRRKQLAFETRRVVDRLDAEPRITTALRWKDFHLLPSFSLRETHYGSRFGSEFVGPQRMVTGEGLWRGSREFTADLAMPSIAKIYGAPRWLGGRFKHVIEPRAQFRYISGVSRFNDIVRFDETDVLSDTNQLQVSVANRFYKKDKLGNTYEALSWQVSQERYFDPTFGGAAVEGRRNVVLSTAMLTGFSFLDGPRRYSPVVSVLRYNPRPAFGLEWRSDYDPLRRTVVNSGLTADGRISKYLVSIGHNHVRSSNVLSASANQVRGLLGVGNENGRGWSAAFTAVYDFRLSVMQFATTQIGYNTDCCGFAVQYRRFSFGTRNENQFRVAFVVANIGSFGTLKRQERIF